MYTCYIKSFKILAEHAGLNLIWSKIHRHTFSHDVAHIEVNFSLFSWPMLPSAQVPVYRKGNGCQNNFLIDFNWDQDK